MKKNTLKIFTGKEIKADKQSEIKGGADIVIGDVVPQIVIGDVVPG